MTNDLAISGDRLLSVLGALSNPLRLRIVAALTANGRNYVSQLAREVGISRPLLHLHLQKLEQAATSLSGLQATLADVSARVAAVETILKQVE